MITCANARAANDSYVDAFAALKIDRDICRANLTSCESSFEKSLSDPNALAWYQDKSVVVGIGVTAFALGFLIGFSKK